MHIVLVEDNEILVKSIKKVLKHHGYTVTNFINGNEALSFIRTNHHTIDLVILDILLPGVDGLEIAKSLRENKIHVPILILTTKNSTDDIVNGFDYGVDDYLKKPFSFDELLVRIRALLRRPNTSIQSIAKITPSIQVDLNSERVTIEGKEVHITTKEFAILSYFIHHPNTLISQDEIYEHVFDFADNEASNTVEVHIKNLRKKLGNKKHEIPLKTIRGRGYRLDL